MMIRREMGVLAAAGVAIAAGTAAGQQVIYSNLVPEDDGFGGVNTTQSLIDSPIADDAQVVGGGVLQSVSFGVVNQPFGFGGGPASSGATLSIGFGSISLADGLPDFDGAPFLVHSFTTDVLDPNIPSVQTVDLSGLGVVIPDNALLMVSIYYDHFDFRHIKASPTGETVGVSTDVIRPYSPGDVGRSGDLMYEITVVPAPAAAGLFGIGGLVALRRRR